MHDDDQAVGRILNRREALGLLCAAGATIAAPLMPTTSTEARARTAARVPGCIARPELIEGPYFIDGQLDRSDIRSDPSTGAVPPGVLLTLAFTVSQLGRGACGPLQGAIVDVWHCDAGGEYSGFDDRRVGFDTRGKTFLRGHQTTDDTGGARFTTIYPGWYAGRAVHIHFKIRTAAAPGQAYEFTSQLFFDEAVNDQVHARPPYLAKGRRDTRNEGDQFFKGGGDQLLLALAPRGDGFNSTFSIGLDLSDAQTGRPDGRRAPAVRGGGRR
jgi:protocatechuate 3,4-dioxygenase beta subunit